MKNIIILAVILLMLGSKLSAHVSVGYFPFNYSMVQLSSNPEKRIFGDLRFQTNTIFSNTTLELAPFVNLKRKEWINAYIGPGLSMNPFDADFLNGYFLSAGLRFKPFERNRNFAVLFELSPYVHTDFESGMLRTNLGLAYCFSRNKEGAQQH